MEILNDYKTSVHKAFSEIEPDYLKLPGLVVCGSHTRKEVDEIIGKIRAARESGMPFLGECHGFQIMCVEWVRDVAGLPEANSTEVDPLTPNPVVVKLKEQKVGIAPVTWFDGTMTYESHWHSYAMNPYYLRYFPPEIWDVSFGEHAIEMLRLRHHPFFVGTQFHSSYQSSKGEPHRLLVDFIQACKEYERKMGV